MDVQTKITSNLNHRNSELHAQNRIILAVLESAANFEPKLTLKIIFTYSEHP